MITLSWLIFSEWLAIVSLGIIGVAVCCIAAGFMSDVISAISRWWGKNR